MLTEILFVPVVICQTKSCCEELLSPCIHNRQWFKINELCVNVGKKKLTSVNVEHAETHEQAISKKN